MSSLAPSPEAIPVVPANGALSQTASPASAEEPHVVNDDGANPEISLYRERTIALLKAYIRFSVEVGRLPSILGREFFRAKVTSYRLTSFEDAVIFVHDVERTLAQLALFHQQVIATLIFQECTKEEAAELLGCARKTITREFPVALDCVSEIFLRGGLLNRLPPQPVEKTCQEGQSADFSLNDCK